VSAPYGARFVAPGRQSSSHDKRNYEALRVSFVAWLRVGDRRRVRHQYGRAGLGSATGGAATGGAATGGSGASTGGVTSCVCEVGESAECASVDAEAFVGGTAVCNEACTGWDTTECLVCTPEVDEKDCTAIDPEAFSGGKATCDADGLGWVTEGCSVCGNGEVEEGEQCEAGVPSDESCVDIGLLPATSGGMGGAGGASSRGCEAATCKLETTSCGKCLAPEGDCLRDDTTSCKDAACSGKQCGITESCEFDCGFQQTCSGMSCMDRASCEFTCGAEANCAAECLEGSRCQMSCAHFAECSVRCAPGATCDVDCNINTGGGCALDCAVGSSCSLVTGFKVPVSGEAHCAAGETCRYVCNNQTDCSALTVTCAAGATCEFSCTEHETICPEAICEPGSTCVFDCRSPEACADVTCPEGATCTGL
jgi:hypothetical protein